MNYNVCHFLEQALGSVRRALQGIEGEVWVVDNNSVDDSVRMVRDRFPEVKLIVNTDNPGFSVANNQAIMKSSGEYILLLNPDTLVEEDTFRQCLAFMDAHPDAGAMGVRLIDGSGKFLPESKRGFPSPWVAFCKTFGLSAIFSRSPVFNKYYLGHLDEHETNEVDVLAGCFMFIRRTALKKAGLLDEAFFMYGEDIDLSYRIINAGFKNYYYPGTSIIHYKGESTKKGSLNYVRTFYQAMIIFARKHFSGRRAGLLILMLQAAIWFRASLTLLTGLWRKISLPLMDAAAIYAGLIILKDFWASYFYKDPDWFKNNVLWFNFPLYILIWLGSAWLSGAYDERYNMRRLVRGLGIGSLILAAVYGFLDLDYRPSRALVLMGSVWAVLATLAIRALMHLKEYGNLNIGREKTKNLVIVGSAEECARVEKLLNTAGINKNLIGFVAAPECDEDTEEMLGRARQLDEITRIFQVNEIIFCSKDVKNQDIMYWMSRLGPGISYKIVPEASLSVIGSKDKNGPGELYTVEAKYDISQPLERRNKRMFDLAICLILPITLPLWAIFSPRRKTVVSQWWRVFIGSKTWIGYTPGMQKELPPIKPGAFTITDGLSLDDYDVSTISRLNFLYARDWRISIDLVVLWKMLTIR